MASFCLSSAIFLALMACDWSLLALASPQTMHVSTISASSAGAPLFSPTLSPDIEPLFPTPGGVAYSPTDSSLPTIPSSPSPPKPQVFGTPGSVLVFPPSASMPATSQASSQPLRLNSVSYLAFLVICIMLFHGM